MERLENVLWDWRARLSATPQRADKRIKLIIIDQASLDYFDKEQAITWPWPRPLYIPVIQFLERAGARALAFDILFTETSQSGVDDDRQFAAAVTARLPVVMAASFSSVAREVDPEKEQAFKQKQIELDGQSAFSARYLADARITKFNSATLPLLGLIRNSSALGVVNAAPDTDGIFRHYKAGAYFKEIPALGLPFALYEVGGQHQSERSELKNFLNRDGQLTLKFHGGSNSYSAFNIVNIIQSEIALQNGEQPNIDPKEFKDAWVLLGVWAPGLLDLRPTPLDQVYRGVEFNATVLDNLLHGDFIRSTSVWVNLLVQIAFVVLACALTELVSSALLQGLLHAALLACMLALGWGLAANGYWMPLATPLLAVISAALGSSLYKYQSEGKQRRFLKSAFARYVSPTVIEQLIKNPALLALGGERRELSIFFSDIEGFTSISEKLPADKLIQLSNSFFSAMTEVILEQGGTLDKYIGDAIVAFWNAPLSIEDHALRAVRAALRCQDKLAQMQPDFVREYGCEVRMRIGIHSGQVTVGNIGSKERFNYTMIGDAANLASRLEGVNKFFGTYTLISERTFGELKNLIAAREIGTVRVVGRQEELKVYEPLGSAKFEASKQDLKCFEIARELFASGRLLEAKEKFAALAHDPVACKYLERIELELKKGAGSEAFSAVWSLSSK